jgi:hypothetical protein
MKAFLVGFGLHPSSPLTPTIMTEEKNNLKAEDLLESGRSITKSEITSVTSYASEIDPVAERRLVRKLDLIMLPLFTLICEFPPISSSSIYTKLG